MDLSSNITPLNTALAGIDNRIIQKESSSFSGRVGKFAASRVLTALACSVLGIVSSAYNVSCFVFKSPVCLAKYTILAIIPIKVSGRWCSLGSRVSPTFGFKEEMKHGLKSVAFIIVTLAGPLLATVSPTALILTLKKTRLVSFPKQAEQKEPQQIEVQIEKKKAVLIEIEKGLSTGLRKTPKKSETPKPIRPDLESILLSSPLLGKDPSRLSDKKDPVKDESDSFGEQDDLSIRSPSNTLLRQIEAAARVNNSHQPKARPILTASQEADIDTKVASNKQKMGPMLFDTLQVIRKATEDNDEDAEERAFWDDKSAV